MDSANVAENMYLQQIHNMFIFTNKLLLFFLKMAYNAISLYHYYYWKIVITIKLSHFDNALITQNIDCEK